MSLNVNLSRTKARVVKDSTNPLFQYWYELESVFEYSEDKEKCFKKDPAGFIAKRQLWLEAIGMAVSPYTDQSPNPSQMEGHWIEKGTEEKKVVWRKAREERERFVRDRTREEDAKKSENHKAAEKKDTKKSSSGRVSKSYSSGYSRYGGHSYGYGYESSYGRYNSGYKRRYWQKCSEWFGVICETRFWLLVVQPISWGIT